MEEEEEYDADDRGMSGTQHDIMFDAIVTVVFKDGDSFYGPLSQLVFGNSKVFPVKRQDGPFRIYVAGQGRAPELKTETTSWFNMYQNGEITPDTAEMFERLEGVIKKLKFDVTKDRFIRPQAAKEKPPGGIEGEWKRKYGFP